MPLDRSRGNTPGSPQVAELSGATIGVGLRYSMNGLAPAVPTRLAPASNVATRRREADRDERRLRWVWGQRTGERYSQAPAQARCVEPSHLNFNRSNARFFQQCDALL